MLGCTREKGITTVWIEEGKLAINVQHEGKKTRTTSRAACAVCVRKEARQRNTTRGDASDRSRYCMLAGRKSELGWMEGQFARFPRPAKISFGQ